MIGRKIAALGMEIAVRYRKEGPSLIGALKKDWASPSSIALSWQQPEKTALPILEYEIKYYEKEHEQLSYSSMRTKAPSVIISGLKAATWYIFCVRTRTAAGYSSYSPKYEYETTGDSSDVASDQGQVLVIVTAAVGGFTLLVILTLFLLITGRCHWYFKAKMTSEEKRRSSYQNGHVPFPGIKTYVDPDTYEDPTQAVHEFTKEIDPSRIRIERVIGAGRPVMIVVEYMENGSLDSFLRVILSIEEGYRLPAPMGCPVALHQLMLHCWQKERSHRPKFTDVVSFLDKLIRNPSSLLPLVEDMQSLPESPESPGEEMDYPIFISIDDWLDSIKMSQYKSNFMAAGYNTLDSVARMSLEDVRHVGVELLGHQRRIISSIQTLRLQLLHEQEKGFHV
ncbi:Ephrin type-A receptor 6 [Takifugu flavidus]|uniref:Ephrin type-A receptor 6 n=1 Tax=Takifugu flavidus TaxID=433684 RepID=A0A5C6PQK4_9TELE|nr:Ephrin type-A receptor 6 [Takifugu flavidus]